MPYNPVESELVTVEEMAARMAMSRTTFERFARIHRIPRVRLGHKTVRYAPESVIAYVTARCTTLGALSATPIPNP